MVTETAGAGTASTPAPLAHRQVLVVFSGLMLPALRRRLVRDISRPVPAGTSR